MKLYGGIRVVQTVKEKMEELIFLASEKRNENPVMEQIIVVEAAGNLSE